jgi:hypothetical protein
LANKQKSSSCGIQFYVLQSEEVDEKIPHNVIHDILDGDISADSAQELTKYSTNFGSSFVSAVRKNMFSHINKLNSVRIILHSICDNMIEFYKDNSEEFKNLTQFFDTDHSIQGKLLSWNVTKNTDDVSFKIWFKSVLILTLGYNLKKSRETERIIDLNSISTEQDLLTFYKQLAMFSNCNLKERSE